MIDSTKAIELIEKSEHIGVLIPKRADADCLASLEVLLRMLETRGKIVGFLESLEPGAPLASDFFPKIAATSVLPKEFIISLDTTTSPVSQLR